MARQLSILACLPIWEAGGDTAGIAATLGVPESDVANLFARYRDRMARRAARARRRAALMERRVRPRRFMTDLSREVRGVSLSPVTCLREPA